tara:strand:- start:7333 stop:7884 length:552 start_codon:yes stop_codon:yes gene_type:complete
MAHKVISHTNTFGLLGVCGILILGFVLQFIFDEKPCPLCLMQRIGFVMVMFGFFLNVVFGPLMHHYSFILLGSVFGAAVSFTQINLYATGEGYGSTILGLHFYEWSHMLFMAIILAVAGLLTLPHLTAKQIASYKMTQFDTWVCYVAFATVVFNIFMTIAECGLTSCPENPDTYWILTFFSSL